MVGYLDNNQESDHDTLQGATAPAPALGDLLSAWWRSDERILAQIEALQVVYVVLIALQVVLCRWRRCSSSVLIKYPLLVAYTVTNPLATYTLGLMVSSPYKSNMFLLWSLSLAYGLGGINNMTAYNVDDNRKYLEALTQHVLVVANLASMANFIPQYKASKTTLAMYKALLVCSYVLANGERVSARMVASNFSDQRSARLQRYMSTEHTESGSYDPVTLRGYGYLVLYDEEITVSDIWLSNQGPLGGGGGPRLKEVCLSSALFILLRRRFFGGSCPEAKLQKTHDLVFNGLLLHVEENYQAAYRIIETELAFAHDHFFTSSASLFGVNGVPYMSYIFLSAGRVTLVYPFVIAVAADFFFSYDAGVLGVPGGRSVIFMTGAIAALSLAVELLQLYIYLTSDWAKVHLACASISRKVGFFRIHHLGNKFPQIFGHWQNKIGQHSLLVDLHSRSVVSDIVGSLYGNFQRALGYSPAFHRGIFRPGIKDANRIPLANDVKLAIARTLKACDGQLSNGASSLQRNGMDQLLWACDQSSSAAENMLVWHIATEYCDIGVSLQAQTAAAEQEGFAFNRPVAATLSRYCAYLIAFVPELIPGHQLETTASFHKVRADAVGFFSGERSLQSKYTKMRNFSPESSYRPTYLELGILLGKLLQEMPDDGQRWEILADLWTEMILYIAPSDNAKDHIQHLGNGGEFLTHLWALLSHAGILDRNEQNANHTPAEETQNSADHTEIDENSACPADHSLMEQMSNSLQLVPVRGSVTPNIRRRPMLDYLPRWIRVATGQLFLNRSWNVISSAARRGTLVPQMLVGGCVWQASSISEVPDDAQDGQLLLPAPETTPAIGHRMEVLELSSSTQQTLHEEV